jgi:hypothetical protein
MYVVDVRGISGVEAARQLLSTTRARVRAGRELRPEAAHYVEVIASGAVDDALRGELLSKLGDHDGVDSVSVSGPPADVGTLGSESPSAAVGQSPTQGGESRGGGWSTVVDAAQRGSTLVGTIVSSQAGDVRVDIDGALGLLRDWEGALPKIGETIRVRVIVLKVKQRRLEVMQSED